MCYQKMNAFPPSPDHKWVPNVKRNVKKYCFCHGVIKLDLSPLHLYFTFPFYIFFRWTSLQFILFQIYMHGALRTRSVRVLRPFLSLVFAMLSLLCGLVELALNHNTWYDLVVGWLLGGAMALYLVSTLYVAFIFYERISCNHKFVWHFS